MPELKHHAPHVPIVLVGTKSDQRDNALVSAELQKRGTPAVSFTEGLALAKEIGAYQFVECSALRNKHVHTVFEAAVRAVLKPRVVKPKRSMCTIM
jgi:GTPase SAR1 family protein